MNFFEALRDRFIEIHTDLARAVEGLPTEALDWRPGPETNSINVLVVHLTAAERFWIGAVALGEQTDRVRNEEFLARGLTSDELKQRLAEADAYLGQSLPRFTLANLDSMHTSPRNNREFSIGWCLLHALEHSALHLGHIQLTRQLWEQQGKQTNVE